MLQAVFHLVPEFEIAFHECVNVGAIPVHFVGLITEDVFGVDLVRQSIRFVSDHIRDPVADALVVYWLSGEYRISVVRIHAAPESIKSFKFSCLSMVLCPLAVVAQERLHHEA